MATFKPITKRDDPAEIAALAARYEALLTQALAIARRNAAHKPRLVRDILATGTVEGLAKSLDSRAAAVSYRAEKYKRTWHSLIGWQYLERATPEGEAAGMLDTIEMNIQMTETDSWPKPPPARAKKRGRKK